MLRPEDVAKDEDIFRPDGYIKIPRSDGDNSYGPPNTAKPSGDEAEVNFYHVFTREEKRHLYWRQNLGEKIAEYFKLPQLSSAKAKWTLYDFPDGYQFTEQRKGPRHNPRTDPYLFGSLAHRFRSTNEALDHIIWLILDPDMNRANCRCKYCFRGTRLPTETAKRTTATGTKRKADLLSASSAAVAGRRGRKPKNADGSVVVQGETSITVRGVEMRRLVPGVTIASVPQRDQEVMHEYKRGEKERYRLGEVVWCELDEPIVDPNEPTRKISSWPAVVQDPSIDFMLALANGADDEKKTSLEAVSAPDQAEESLPMLGAASGATTQSVAYQINFLGTTEKAMVSESSLTPYLVGLIPPDLGDVEAGPPADHAWLFEPGTWPQMNLSRQPHLPAPPFLQAVVAFCFAVETAAVLRNLYNLTDAYSMASTPEGVLRDMGASEAGGEGEGQQGMRHYQGMYLGTERIWVGDVVRLKLPAKDVQKLQRELNSALVADQLPGAPEPKAIVLDENASYVLQLAAIYEDPRAPKVQRVSGEIFEIISANKLDALQAAAKVVREQVLANEAVDEATRQEEAKLLEARMPKASILTGRAGFPPMPTLPPGFVFVSLSDRLQSRIPRETTLSVGHVAGRLYASLGMHSDGPRVAEQLRLRPTDRRIAADEDTQVELRARLSLAGLLSGCVKAMRSTVMTYSRTLSFKGAFAVGRETVGKLISGTLEESDDEGTTSKTSSPTKTPAQKARKSDAAAAAAATAPEAAGAATDAAHQNGTAAQTQTNTQETVQTATSQTQTAQEQQSPAPASEADEPLPPNWEARVSRSHGGTYYVYLPTKKTQWERPTS